MDDKTMLEMAARAAGIAIHNDKEWFKWSETFQSFATRYNGYWNPLTDDGDRYRLMASLKMRVCFRDNFVSAGGIVINWPEDEPTAERAAVRAAAEIGKGMGVG